MVLVETAIIVGFVLLTGYAVLSIGGGSSSTRSRSRSRTSSAGSPTGSSSTSSSGTTSTSVPESSEGRRRFLSSLRDKSPNVREGLSGAFGSFKQRFSGEKEEIQELEGKVKALIENEANLEETIEVLKDDHPELAGDLNKLENTLGEDEDLQKDLIKHIEHVLKNEEDELQELMKIESLREEIEDELLSDYDEVASDAEDVEEVRNRTDQLGETVSNIWGRVWNGEADPEEAAEELEEVEKEAEGLRSKLNPIRNRLSQAAGSLGSFLSRLRNLRGKEDEVESEEGETDKEIKEEREELKEEKSRFKRAVNIFQGSIEGVLNKRQLEEFKEIFGFDSSIEEAEEEVVEEETETEEEVESATEEIEGATEEDMAAVKAIKKEIEEQKQVAIGTREEVCWHQIRAILAKDFVVAKARSDVALPPAGGHLGHQERRGHLSEEERQNLVQDIKNVVEIRKFGQLSAAREIRAIEMVEKVINDFENMTNISEREVKEMDVEGAQAYTNSIKEDLEKLKKKLGELEELVKVETEDSEEGVGFDFDHE